MDINEVIRQLDRYNAGEAIDPLTENLLVEICAGYAEGRSINQLSKALDLDKRLIRAVLKRNRQMRHDGKQIMKLVRKK